MTKPYAQVAQCHHCETVGHVGYKRVSEAIALDISTKLTVPVPYSVDLLRDRHVKHTLPAPYRFISHTFFCDNCDVEFATITAMKTFPKAKDYIDWLCRDHAAGLRQQAEELFGCGDDELGGMYVDDAEVAARIAALIGQTDYDEALALLRSQDSGAREKFDDEVWNFLDLQEEARR